MWRYLHVERPQRLRLKSLQIGRSPVKRMGRPFLSLPRVEMALGLVPKRGGRGARPGLRPLGASGAGGGLVRMMTHAEAGCAGAPQVGQERGGREANTWQNSPWSRSPQYVASFLCSSLAAAREAKRTW